MSSETGNRQGRRPLLVALTGGVASGKTSVSDGLAELGAPVIDTDLIAREMVAPGKPGLKHVVEAFGPDIVGEDGALDRGKLREVVFSSDEERRKLESILHPLIEAEARRRVDEYPDADYVVLVVPLLVESGVFGDADRVVVVDAPQTVQIERLMRRDSVDETQARAMLQAQASRDERLAAADHVIDNSATLNQLQAQVERLHRRLTAEATQ